MPLKWFRTPSSRLTQEGLGGEGWQGAESATQRIWDTPLQDVEYFVVDIETSGFSAERDLILSLAAGCLKGTHPDFSEFFYRFIQHDNVDEVPEKIWKLTGITPDQLRRGENLSSVLRDALSLSVNKVWIAHHARHEMSFLQRQARLLWKLKLRPIVVDTAVVAQALGRLSRVPTLDEVCRWLDVPASDRHQADADVRMTAEVWRREMQLCEQAGLQTVSEVIDWTSARAMG